MTTAATGDRLALERLIVRWQPRLLRRAWRVLGDAERARDIVQEAWMEILRGIDRTKLESTVRCLGIEADDAFEQTEA